MFSTQLLCRGFAALTLALITLPAAAQSFRVQCPTKTITHPTAANSEPAYVGPTYTGTAGYPAAPAHVNGAIKCQQISGGDGYASMGDGTQTYLFSFGPLSGLADIAAGLPGTQFPGVFNTLYSGAPLQPGAPDGSGGSYNGAVGQVPDADNGNAINGHVDPRPIMDVGVMNGNIPAPLMAIDEDDEFFLTLTNVGMIMRPDLFEQHTVHYHGYPNASSFYDGVPDASVAINIGASFTYYYLAPDAGTYFWHCHITPPEHLQMGMVGQIYVRPRQNRVPASTTLYAALQQQQLDPRTACNSAADILCSNPLPAVQTTATGGGKYAYNDGDGSTAYDVEYPIQIHGFDPNFHFVGMTFNPEGFADMKDKYFLLNGRSYPDTVTTGPLETQSADGVNHFSQPLPSIINIPAGGKALLRISDLDVTEYQTLASLGIPMTVIGINAKMLRDQAGNNLYYNTNSITLGGGESLDVILDACQVRAAAGTCTTPYAVGDTYYLYTPNLDHLSNDAENFGGLMTEVHII
ncbi:MAG: multicopper oxidase family protein [Gammaproteobacteria bacterium]|nr:MAG: multicopper oxidase family protein [Gammaproteobacteria bacterium]TLZ48039.1 MAG: multicopper oxidase family protein [Gammaproteobacteria bacterium]